MRTRHLATALICSVLFAPIVAAQTDAATPKPGKPVAVAAPAAPDASGPIITVEFPGGTAKQFIDTVRQAAEGRGSRVNVVIPKEAESVPLPAISLRDVATYTALRALEYAADPNALNQFSVGILGKGDEASITYAIRYNTRFNAPSMPTPPPPKLETRVISLRDLVDAPAGLEKDPSMVTSPETILNALRAASQLDVDAKVAPPEIMFHKDSQLLIFRGTAEQINTLQSVIGQLNRGLDSRRAEAASLADRDKAARLQKAELQAQVDLNATQAKMADAEVDRTSNVYTRISELVKAGQASTTDLDNARAEAQKARVMRDQAAAAERNLKERQTILEARAQAGGGPGGGSGETPVVVIYEYTDLQPFSSDVWGIISAVTRLRGGKTDMTNNVHGPGTLSLRATPAEHAVIVKALNAMRRAKANEPKLPGLDAEDLIRKGEGK